MAAEKELSCRQTAQSCKKIVQKYAKNVDTSAESWYSKTVSLYIYLCLVFVEALIHNMLILLVSPFFRVAAKSAAWGLERCRIISDEGQAEGMNERTQGKKLRCTRCSCRRSGRRGCCGCFPVAAAAKFIVGDGSPVPSGRKFSRSGGRVPYSHPCGADSKTHFAAFLPHLPSLRNSTGIFQQPLFVGRFARQPIRSEWARNP